MHFVRSMNIFIAGLCLLLTLGSVSAIHPEDWLPEERPEEIDTVTSLTTKRGHFKLSYTAAEDGVPLNTLHNWTLKILNKDGIPVNDAIIVLYGDMPEHRHGMVTKPRVRKGRRPGEYTVQGMKFHMPGWWIMVFDISPGNQRDGGMFNFIVGEDVVSGCCCTDEPTCRCDHSSDAEWGLWLKRLAYYSSLFFLHP